MIDADAKPIDPSSTIFEKDAVAQPETPPAEIGEFEKMAVGIHTDLAYTLFKESLEMDPGERDLIARRVKRKLDFIVLPMVCSLQSICRILCTSS